MTPQSKAMPHGHAGTGAWIIYRQNCRMLALIGPRFNPMAKHHWMIENADELRTNANQRRARGEHVGASAKGWDAKRPSDPDDWAMRAQIAREQLKLDVQNAWNTYRSACLNIRHGEELDAIPF